MPCSVRGTTSLTYRPVIRQHSGRVIAIGRLLLAALFLLAIWLDSSQPAQAEEETYALLCFYVLAASTLVAMTWNDWWLDGRLAAPAHVLDIAIFTLLVYSTEGYTSPFFLFFVFLLLSAAIRWSWQATALTAAAVIILYLAAGLVVASFGPAEFDLQRFIIRCAHLIILSAILIWFEVNAGSGLPPRNLGKFDLAAPDEPPLETALSAAMDAAGAARGVILWLEHGSGRIQSWSFDHTEMKALPVTEPVIREEYRSLPFLYDFKGDRAVSRDSSRRLRFGCAQDWLSAEATKVLRLTEGIAVPVRSETGRGELFLEDVPGLALDDIEGAAQIAVAVGEHLRRHTLFIAIEESSESRARLSLARDLHDSIVQFLAGAAFRIEAVKRQSGCDAAATAELEDLKQLILQEQTDLREILHAMRSGGDIALSELAGNLELLCQKLCLQWDMECAFSADIPERLVPLRLNLATRQIVSETVANAARHGRATRVEVTLSSTSEALELTLTDDGHGFPLPVRSFGEIEDLHPRSLSERVHEAGGSLVVQSSESGSTVHIRLPTGRR